MDNETPRYASWIPAAGGYVANGNVVSKSPIYDEAGKLKLDVDTSVFGNTNPSHSTLADQGHRQLAQKQAGMSTLNIAGSNEDANATATGIGSMGNLSQNTQNAVDSVLSSPAMRSPSAGEPILSLEQQDLKEIQDAKARNDLQGMINGYIKLGRDTGADYSATISDLTKQRQQKIQGIDDQYLQLLDEARRNVNSARDVANISGDKADIQAYNNALAEYNNLLNEQGNWRDSVGYADAMAQMQATREEELQLDFDFAYNTAINDIANQLIQMYPSILNFQYNPNTDTSLYIAQGYAQSRVKETMNATGMYYSTMTQSAISKAVAELVPVYEKMARQEAIENFQLLQSTASFLMNLEQTQFNLWKSQIEMKWQENAEKRKAIAQAIENANARGYFTNEEAALLGVAPGTESPDARARAQAKQDQIEAEQRKLIQDKALERFKTDMDIELLKEQNKLKTIAETTPGQRTKWGSYNTKELLSYFNDLVKQGATDQEIADKLWAAAESQEAYDQAAARIANGDIEEPDNNKSISAMQSELKNMVGTYKPSEILSKAYELATENNADIDTLLNAISYEKNDESELSGKMFDPRMLDKMGANGYANYLDYLYDNDGNATDMIDNIDTLITTLNNAYGAKQISAEEYGGVLEILNRDLIANQYLNKTLTTAKLGTDDAKKTKTLVDNARKILDGYATTIYESQAPSKEDIIADLYTRLVNNIGNTSDKFDYNWAPGNTGKASKTEAIRNIIYSVRDNPTYGKATAPSIYSTVVSTANNLAGQGKINEIDTTLIGNPENTPVIL